MMVRLLFLFIALFQGLQAAWIVKNGKVMDANEAPSYSCEEHFARGTSALERGDYEAAASQFWIVEKNFPKFSETHDAAFFCGASLFEIGEYDRANEILSNYLKNATRPRYFEETMTYKIRIADSFREGARRRLLGYKRLPKWSTGRTIALKIYEEVATAMPCHDFGAHALYCRGVMLFEKGEYTSAIEAFQLLIRRFPKHELTPVCYLAINRVYIDQALVEYQNPDLLPLAEINLGRFRDEFPRDERLVEAEADVALLKELYAEGLYKTACFYVTQDKPDAAQIYFRKAISLFPDTDIARRCQNCLNYMKNPQ